MKDSEDEADAGALHISYIYLVVFEERKEKRLLKTPFNCTRMVHINKGNSMKTCKTTGAVIDYLQREKRGLYKSMNINNI